MNVSVALVMRLAVLGLVLVAACGDNYSLDVSVQHPDNAGITRTVVTIYESPAAALSCVDIEYHDISDDELEGLVVAQIEVTETGTVGALDGISRAGTKLVVARGFRPNNLLFTAGCTEQGTVSGTTKVVVETRVVAVVSPGGVEPDAGEVATIPLTITTPLGEALPKRAVTWRVFGFAGATPMASPAPLTTTTDQWEPTQATCAGMDGAIRLRPVPPSQIGGYAAQVRVSWGQEAPRQFTGFTKIDVNRKSLALLSNVARHCTARASATAKRVVCIEDNDPTAAEDPIARDLSVAVASGSATLQINANQNFAEQIAGVYSVQSGSVRDAYAISRLGRVIGLFGPSRAPGTQVLFNAGTEGLVVDAMVIPICKMGDTAKLVVKTVSATKAKIWIMDPLGGPHQQFFNLESDPTEVLRLNSAGCVTDLGDQTTRQVVVVDNSTRMGTLAYFDCGVGNGKCVTRLPLFRFGVGFKRGTESRMVAPLFDATGTVLSEFSFLDGKLVERRRYPSASFPERIVNGDFDSDADSDLLWNFASLSQTTTNFQIAYAREVGGVPLSALSGQQEGVIDDMFVADVNGDTFDDIIVVGSGRDQITMMPANGVAVIPTRVAAAPITLTRDDMCVP